MEKAKVDRDALEKLRRHFAGESEAPPDAARPAAEAPRYRSPDEDEVALLRNLSLRCAAKAAAIRCATAPTADGAPELGETCDFWMQPYLSRSDLDQQDWIVLAGSYEVLGSVADQWSHLVAHQALVRYRKEGYALAAEAQSALREAVQRIRPAPDDDQAAIFRWLRRRSQEEQVRIDRYMRSADVASSAAWQERMDRVVAWRTMVQDARTSERQKRKLTGKLR